MVFKAWQVRPLLGFLMIVLALPAATALAQGGEAHVHGVSTLLIAVEEDGMVLELTAPGDDLVGFEHAPVNQSQRDRVAKAIALLRGSDELFQLPAAAGCTAEEATLLDSLSGPVGEGVDQDHDHKHGGEAPAKTDHHDEPTDEHGEFRLRYHYHCRSPEKLNGIDVNLFDLFPHLRAIVVNSVSARGQSSSRLDRDRRRAAF